MLKDIIQGISAYFSSFGLISKLKLWKYFLIPILISVFFGLAIGGLTYSLSDDIGIFITKIWIWDWGKEAFETIGTLIGGISIIAIGFIVYRHVVMALASPFMSPVSEAIEKYYYQLHGGETLNLKQRKTNFAQQLMRGIRINIRNLFKELMITIGLLILSFIPIVNIISAPLLFLVQSYYAGFGSMDYTLERYYNYRGSINFGKKNKGIAIGNGIVFMLLLFIPIIGFIIVLPLSVTSSSLKTIEKINNER